MKNASETEFADHYERIEQYPTGLLGNQYAAPAIAIPLKEKSAFECPLDHIELLTKLLPQTDRILIIGWKAAEQHFQKMLSAALQRQVSTLVVCGSNEEGQSAVQSLRGAGIHGQFDVFEGGFSQMIYSRRLDGFLNPALAMPGS
jgi:hypothetical protein